MTTPPPLLFPRDKIINGDLYRFFVDTSSIIHECFRYDQCKSSQCEQLTERELPREVRVYAEHSFSGWREDIPRQDVS